MTISTKSITIIFHDGNTATFENVLTWTNYGEVTKFYFVVDNIVNDVEYFNDEIVCICKGITEFYSIKGV